MMETTNQVFRITRAVRICVLFGLIVFYISFSVDIYTYFFDTPNKDFFGEFSIDMIIALVIAYCAIGINKTQYRVEKEMFVVKSFMINDKIYKFSDIKKIKEIRTFPFSYNKIYFNNNIKLNMLPIENQNEFIQIFHHRLGPWGQ